MVHIVPRRSSIKFLDKICFKSNILSYCKNIKNMFCFEHILLNYSKGSETSSGNLLVPLLIYNNMSCKL